MKPFQTLLVMAALPCLAHEIPAGTELQIRLSAPVSSESATAGQQISAVLIAPVAIDGAIVMNAGAAVTGRVKDVTSTKAGAQARLTPQFDEVRDAAGHRAKLAAKLTAIDNARETVNGDGQIVGIQANQTLSSALDKGIAKLADQYSDFAGILGAAKNAAMDKTDASINYPAGVEMTLTLTAALDWTAPVEPSNLRDTGPADALVALVNSEPFRTFTDKTNKPSDITNIMFLGSEEQIRGAFEAAGWSNSDALDETSKFQTFRAMADMSGYKQAPMSVLILDARPPELTLQKLVNTFSARHHLRIWRRPETFDGRPVWVCSSTHDTGIGFSDSEHTFIHQIDSDIDRERAKVVSDLVFTGRVTGIALVDRDDVPTSAFNGTGDEIHTDGRMVVIEF